MGALIFILFVFVILPVTIIVGIASRVSAGRALRLEATRVAALPDLPRSRIGASWEIERARLIDGVIAPACGAQGIRLVRHQPHIRRELAEILDRGGPSAGANTPAALSDWSSDPTAPRMGDHSFAAATGHGERAGRSYTVHGDGRVVSIVSGKPMTWRSVAGFEAWAESNPG